MESRTNKRFWAACNKEFDPRDLIHIVGENRENCRGRLFVLAFVKGINDDEGLNVGGFEWPNNDFLHLGN